jgi:hypothetical protein
MTLYQPLPPIPLVQPLVGTFIESTARLPVPENPPAGGGASWGGGVASPSYQPDPGAWPGAACLAGFESDASAAFSETVTISDKADTGGDCTIWKFDPFIVYEFIEAEQQSPDAQDRARPMVDNWLDAQFSAAVARAFYRGAPIDGLVVDIASQRNPIPRTQAVDLTSVMGTPTGVAPETVVANLLAAYYGCRFAGGAVLHIPPLILPYLVSKGLVAQVGSRYLGPGGVVVISDPGMPSASTLETIPGSSLTYGLDTAAGESWCFVTGPVECSYSDPVVMLDGMEQVYDVRQNRWVYVVERRAIFRWDPECCFAAAAFAPSPATSEA